MSDAFRVVIIPVGHTVDDRVLVPVNSTIEGLDVGRVIGDGADGAGHLGAAPEIDPVRGDPVVDLDAVPLAALPAHAELADAVKAMANVIRW